MIGGTGRSRLNSSNQYTTDKGKEKASQSKGGTSRISRPRFLELTDSDRSKEIDSLFTNSVSSLGKKCLEQVTTTYQTFRSLLKSKCKSLIVLNIRRNTR